MNSIPEFDLGPNDRINLLEGILEKKNISMRLDIPHSSFKTLYLKKCKEVSDAIIKLPTLVSNVMARTRRGKIHLQGNLRYFPLLVQKEVAKPHRERQ